MQMKNAEIEIQDYQLSAADIASIEEGLAQLDKGEVIPHEAVKAWVFSLGTNNPLPMPQSYDFK